MLCYRAGLVPAVVDFLDLQHANNNRYNLRVARWLVIGGALPPPQLKALRVPHRVRGFIGTSKVMQHAQFSF